MPLLNKIVNDINEAWKNTALTCGPLCDCTNILHPLAETMIDSSQAAQNILTTYPGIADFKGEVLMIDVNDSYDLTLFHKLETIVNTLVLNKGYGDNPGELQEAASMAVLVIAWKSKIKMEAHELEARLKNSLPLMPLKYKNEDGHTVQTSRLTAGASTFDKTALLQREYTRVELNFPDLILFEMKYLVNSTYKKECLEICK